MHELTVVPGERKTEKEDLLCLLMIAFQIFGLTLYLRYPTESSTDPLHKKSLAPFMGEENEAW